MTPVTEHFSEEELGIAGLGDLRIRQNALYHCQAVLEPIRAQFKVPLLIDDGYRPPAHNQQTGGVSNSEHLAQGGHFATDFRFGPDVPLTHAFNWIRISGLPFRQVILEMDADNMPACIHISTDRNGPDKHQALIGHTHGQGSYAPVPCEPITPEPVCDPEDN